MKIKDGFMLKTVAGSNIVVPVGTAELNFRGMMTLNEVGTIVWKALEEDTTPEKIAEKIVEEYNIDLGTALRDVKIFIEKLSEKNIIEE